MQMHGPAMGVRIHPHETFRVFPTLRSAVPLRNAVEERSELAAFRRWLRLFSVANSPAPAAADLPSALNLIQSQPSHYAVATVAGRKYLLAPRDVLTVPRLRDVRPGDSLLLDAVHEFGSREYAVRGTLPVRVTATVLEHTKGPMLEIFKKKRRKGYEKTIKHKQTYTRLRIGSIQVTL
ncbi:unnamed protein product [Rhizoctonia solani]|uniref:Large ribosomal subunit protein bL21m n=1 Tax=Rhizoctonia solani TaxID=456999 RepID=A0A8H3AF56_9AGAM|nr:unnamed protein product [Rhizoctonia solani]